MSAVVVTKIMVGHAFYGCDTGCCGHVITVQKSDGSTEVGDLDFGHPNSMEPEVVRVWAREFVEDELGTEHTKDLDWDNVLVLDDVAEE